VKWRAAILECQRPPAKRLWLLRTADQFSDHPLITRASGTWQRGFTPPSDFIPHRLTPMWHQLNRFHVAPLISHDSPNGDVVVSKTFRFSGEYFKEVAHLTSEHLGWKSVWLCRTRESSNDVAFLNARKNSLTLDLSGTKRHLTVMDGKTEERATGIGDICGIPVGCSARFAWETLGDAQTSLILEFGDDIFLSHCPEIVSDRFLAGHLMPSNYAAMQGLSQLIRVLARELESGDRRGRLFCESLMRLIAMEIAHALWTRRPDDIILETVIDRRVKAALGFIEENFASDVSLEDLRGATGLNATQLISVFRRATGTTPYAYVIRRRLKEAANLLRGGNIPISQISLEVGFSDQQQMTRAFRKYLGMTPGSLRARQQP
jgi:AraC family transcriptional regulator